MQRHFDTELADLKKSILNMGSMVETAISTSINALKLLDKKMADTVISNDKAVDELELKIDEECLDLLALRQPMALDLRFVTMAMKITTDLERMSDLAVDIAQRVCEIADEPQLKPLIDIPSLAKLAQEMVRGCLDAFVKEDPGMAKSVILLDPEADDLRDLVQKELIEDYMIKDPVTVKRAVRLLLIARHLERICDHATNIAEDVIYMVRAKVVKHRAGALKNGT